MFKFGSIEIVIPHFATNALKFFAVHWKQNNIPYRRKSLTKLGTGIV